MFTILMKKAVSKKYGKSVFDRYFHHWDNAQEMMDKEVKELTDMGAVIIRSIDRMNVEKGFYEYEKTLVFHDDEREIKISFALINGYFQDELINTKRENLKLKEV